MASGIFAILDDVAMLLDDVSAMSKLAAKKTAGLLGDDLAVNAEKATGFRASRELPVIWAITKGSLLNKIIIVPLAMLMSRFLPELIVPILLLGGAYLCFEGAEKVFEWFFHSDKKPLAAAQDAEPATIVNKESAKIKAAIRTDFILSIEIVVITLGTVVEQELMVQLLVVSFISLLATVGVYGLVALLVRMDDSGLFLIERAASMQGIGRRGLELIGRLLVSSLPRVIRLLGVLGTVAMLLVGGGIYVHNIETIHHYVIYIPLFGGELLTGLMVGSLILGLKHVMVLVRK